MGFPTPDDNYQGYEEASLFKKAQYIAGKDLFMAHGMADRNVHFQHSMVLAKELIKHQVAFKQQVKLYTFYIERSLIEP